MGKLKTKKGVAKRFKISKKGRVVYHGGGKSHLLSSKKAKRLRKLRRTHRINSKKDTHYIKQMLPYGSM